MSLTILDSSCESYVCLISLSIMSSRSIHDIANAGFSFVSRLYNIPLNIQTTFLLSLHLSMDMLFVFLSSAFVTFYHNILGLFFTALPISEYLIHVCVSYLASPLESQLRKCRDCVLFSAWNRNFYVSESMRK